MPEKKSVDKIREMPWRCQAYKTCPREALFLSIIRLFTVETLLADSFFYPQRNSPLGIVLIVVVRQIIKLRSVHKI